MNTSTTGNNVRELGATQQRRVGTPAGGSKYQQVAAALAARIEAGTLPGGALLPSESELVATYGVSVPTARAAIRALRERGLVTTLQGRGSFVRRPNDRPAHTHPRGIARARSGDYLDGTTDPSTQPAVWTDAETPGRSSVAATPTLALALGVAEHTPIFLYDRLLTDPAGARVAYRLYVPITTAADVPALEEDPYRDPADLYHVLADTYGVLSFTENVRARIPTPDDTMTLQIPEGAALLIARRETRDDTGRLLALEETRISGDDTQIVYTLTPPQPRSKRGSASR